MSRCFDSRPLSELDPVTFFIVTELMAAEREGRTGPPEDCSAVEFPESKVA